MDYRHIVAIAKANMHANVEKPLQLNTERRKENIIKDGLIRIPSKPSTFAESTPKNITTITKKLRWHEVKNGRRKTKTDVGSRQENQNSN